MSSTPYTARFTGPTLVEKGRDTVITCPVYRDGALVVPTVVAVSIWTSGGSSVVAAGAGSVVGSIATYTVPAASTSALSYGADWRVEWSLTLATVVEVIPTDAALVRNQIRCPIGDGDLYSREPSLNPNGAAPIHSLSTLQPFVDDAWITLMQRLLSDGQYPWKTPSAAVVREAMLCLTLSRVFMAFTTGLNESYGKSAEAYGKQYQEAYRTIRYTEVVNPDDPSPSGQRTAVTPNFYLGQPKRRSF